MAGMILADMGAEVIRIERGLKIPMDTGTDPSLRGKQSIALNLKSEAGQEAFFRLIEGADALLEGYRPGVTERLGIGPDDCLARNSKLVYGRMTGWGQEGPLAQAAGHDINYVALTGALHAIGERDGPPVLPLNLVGDMGGGGMLLAFGVACALFETGRSGEGQVVDAAMVDGASLLMWMQYGWLASGHWNDQRGSNMLDGAAHFYGVYETADGKYVSIGAIEPQFYAELLRLAELDTDTFSPQLDPRQWMALRKQLEARFREKTRDEWCAIMEGSDVCFAPVLSMHEAPEHAHNRARGTFVEVDGYKQPGPAPRFSRTRPEIRHGRQPVGGNADQVLRQAGYTAAEVERLKRDGAVISE